MDEKLIVSSSPHFKSDTSISKIMGSVIFALCPILVMATVAFGLRALTMTAVSIASCMLSETLFCLVAKRRNTVGDFSCVVTGMILSFCLPVTTSYILVAAGGAFATVVVKMLFGGLGCNFLNPALTARAFLYTWVSFSSLAVIPFSSDKVPLSYDTFLGTGSYFNAEAVSGNTLAESLGDGTLSDVSIWDVLVGNYAGNLGEIFIGIIVICGLFLVFSGIITWHIPVAYIVGVAAIAALLPFNGQIFSMEHVFIQVFSGGVVFAAFFIATDYSTSPMTGTGRFIYGVCGGALTVLFRYFGCPGDGVTFAILFMNIFAYALDRVTRPRRYGKGGENINARS